MSQDGQNGRAQKAGPVRVVEVALPSVVVGWDAQAQAVRLHFDPTDFKTWEFVAGILGMARAEAERLMRLGQLQQFKDGQAAQMAAQQQAAQQEAAIRKKLELG